MPSPPAATRGGVVDLVHGVAVADPYQWLEEPATPQSRHWSAAQDQYWREIRSSLPMLDWWRERVAEYLDVDFESAPIWRGGTRFFMRHQAGSVRPGLYATAPDGGPRELLGLLPEELTTAASLQAWQPSRDGRLLALTLSARGSEDASMLIMDVATGRLIGTPVDRCGHTSMAWLPDGRHLLYVRRPTPDANRRVYLHQVGADPTGDRLLFARDHQEPIYFSLAVSDNGRWLAISASDGSPASGNELWLAELGDAASSPALRQIQAWGLGSSGVTFGPDGLAYLLTSRDAPNWRIMVADPVEAEYEKWRELVPPDPAAVIADFAILARGNASQLLVSWIRDAVSEISVHELLTGRRLRDVPLPPVGRVGPLVTRHGDGEHLWFSYTDSTTPPHVFEYTAGTGTARVTGAGGRSRARVRARTDRLWCTSADDTRVQLIAVRPPDASGPAPTILSGYGGFGTSVQPTYSAATMAWVGGGGTYVMANVRGGGERGESWHASGRGHRKQNAIDDFLAVARYLVEHGWTTPAQLGAWGGSNGALLVAAAVTQRPDLFAAAVCTAPLCDMIRYERSGLGSVWRSEYGSAEVVEDFHHLLAYSPYHNVVPGRTYPATLFVISDDDERVDPGHARKMCAALQHANAGPAPVALRRERNVGHSARARSSAVDMGGDVLAFLASYVGLRP